MFVGFGYLGQTFRPLKSTLKTAQKTYLGQLHIFHGYWLGQAQKSEENPDFPHSGGNTGPIPLRNFVRKWKFETFFL